MLTSLSYNPPNATKFHSLGCPSFIPIKVTKPVQILYNGKMRQKFLNLLLGSPAAPFPVPIRREIYVRRFLSISRFLLKRVFHRLDLELQEDILENPGPLIIYANHPSFWDPLTSVLAAQSIFPSHKLFGPIEREALLKHWYFQGLGFFGIETNSVAGYRQFRQVSQAILSQVEQPCLVITPEGTFTDPTTRPLGLKRGLAHLIASLPESPTLCPLAIDYRLGALPKPTAWLYLGRPFKANPESSPHKIHSLLTQRLEQSMDANARRMREGEFGKNLLESRS